MSMRRLALAVVSTRRTVPPAVPALFAPARRAVCPLAVYLILLFGAEPAHAQRVELELADSSSSTCADCPHPPTGYAAPGPDIGQISICWEPSGLSGRPEAFRWYVFVAEADNVDVPVIGRLLGKNARSVAITVKSPGTEYRVVVRGVSEANQESLSITAMVRAKS